jgi:hypothetical protein
MYSTPELLLVGAAQHLVLGDSPISAGTQWHCDTDEKFEAGITYIDESAW